MKNPYGITLTRAEILDTSNVNGCTTAATQPDTCLALIMKDGWVISDQYPWFGTK